MSKQPEDDDCPLEKDCTIRMGELIYVLSTLNLRVLPCTIFAQCSMEHDGHHDNHRTACPPTMPCQNPKNP